MVKRCPRCDCTSAWRLADGRFKCRTCGSRYSWTSVWDSVRLPEPAKQALLQAFVEGVPAYRQRFREDACIDSRERFYRLLRACCVRQGTVSYDALYIAECQPSLFHGARTAMRGWATSRRVMIIGICERAAAVQIAAPSASVGSILPLVRAHSAIGGVLCIQDDQAFANLQVQGDYAILPRPARAPLAMRVVELFWSYARTRLQAYHKIPLKFIPLYLGEVCLRFNHREQDLVKVLGELSRTLSIGEVRPLLSAMQAHWLSPDRELTRRQGEGALQRRLSVEA